MLQDLIAEYEVEAIVEPAKCSSTPPTTTSL